MNANMARAYEILSTFTDEQLYGFIMMFESRKSQTANETDEQRKARKKAAFERILANRVTVSPDFDEKQELLDYLDERYGV